MSAWIKEKHDLLEDPQYRRLYVDFDRAFEWHPDDPRLDDLAHAMLAYLPEFESETYDPPTPAEDEPAPDATLIALVESSAVNASPAWQRLTQLLNQTSGATAE